jgi:hypothetical protein
MANRSCILSPQPTISGTLICFSIGVSEDISFFKLPLIQKAGGPHSKLIASQLSASLFDRSYGNVGKPHSTSHARSPCDCDRASS